MERMKGKYIGDYTSIVLDGLDEGLKEKEDFRDASPGPRLDD